MNRLTTFVLSRIRGVVIVAGFFLLVYYLLRAFFFVFADYSLLDRIFGGFLFIGECYILVHAFGFIINVFRGKEQYEVPRLDDSWYRHPPPVAVIVAARHEPKQVLRETFTTLVNLDYDNKNIYLLDDSSEPAFIGEADGIGEEFGITIFRRPLRHGAKAGIVNDFIRKMDEKYIAIFDADQNPMPDFLKKTVSHLEHDEKIAFVQTPQFYTNMDAGPVARAATIQQAIFYEAICEGKSISNAMFCCGTNVVFRKSALEDVGGFDEENITEDFATSVKLHSHGYRSLYLNHVSAFGMAPEGLPEYFKQQIRWASGTINVFRKLILTFLRNPASLTPAQWWEYFLAGSYYFIGWAFFLLMISPVAYLLFSIPSYFMHPAFYIGVFLPYYILSLMIFYTTMIRRAYSFGTIYLGTIMGMLCFPILMKASVYGLVNKKMTFTVTTKGRSKGMPFWRLWPYHVMVLVNMIAIEAGFLRIGRGEYTPAIIINMIWVSYHLFILFHIYFLNRVRAVDA